VTATAMVPLAPRSLAETAMVSCEELTNVALRELPFQVTVELDRKFEPVMVSVKPLEPAAALLGEIDWIEGAGLLGGGGVELPVPQEQSKKTRKPQMSPWQVLRNRFMAFSSSNVVVIALIIWDCK